jgi:hypothetical protein
MGVVVAVVIVVDMGVVVAVVIVVVMVVGKIGGLRETCVGARD